jgi:competence protein ComFC
MTNRSRLGNRFAPWLQALLNLLYPRTCRVCDVSLTDRDWFCRSCEQAFPTLDPPFCQVCGEPYDGPMDRPFRCDNCADRKLHFDFAIAGYRAEGEVRELIHRFKYGRDITLRAPLGRMLCRALDDPRLQAEDLRAWTLVPVPLHRTREREREFNQSHELCLQLARHTGIPVQHVMKRLRPTDKQARLTRAQRLENLRGAFSLRRGFQGKASPLAGAKVLLVDDVFTTGATTDECARILRREAKVQKVVVIAVARG